MYMKSKIVTIILVFIELLICLSLFNCVHGTAKFLPEYPGEDPKVVGLVNEYKELAKNNGITFKKQVSIGFKDIKDKDIVGMCYYGSKWREIDLDTKFWENSNSITRLTLLFHELGHCYCNRDHDYRDGKKYKEANTIKEDLRLGKSDNNGFYDDHCPLSMMYPIVLENFCILSHYDDYMKELFNRCDPW